MATKRTSASDKAHHMTYKAQMLWAKNRKIKLERALKKNPKNLQIVAALKSISYRRKTPTTSVWNHTDKYMAQLIKQVCGFCDRNIFHANKDLRAAAFSAIAAKCPKGVTSLSSSTKSMFSLKTRAHSKGELIWAS